MRPRATYQDEQFVQALRDHAVAPHVSEYTQGANMGKNNLTEEERQDEQRAIRQRKRKLIEKIFGWSKLDRPLHQVKLRGLKRVNWFYQMTISAYNLVRMRRLMPTEALACQGRSVSGGRKNGLQTQNEVGEQRKKRPNGSKI
jgi:hypothetical protein